MKTVKQIVSCGITGMLMLGCVSVLSGCDQVSSVTANNPISNLVSSSKKTGNEDYKNYTIVQDVDGDEYATIVYLEQNDETDFDVQLIKELLSENNVNWYQLIATSSMGTNQQQYGYLFFPQNVSYTEMEDALAAIKKEFSGHICTEKEYKEFVEKSDESMGAYDLYNNKITYYGPAAGK